MGLLRWATIIGTGGLAPIKGTSPRERTAKAAEKQARLQRQALRTARVPSAAPQSSATPVGLDSPGRLARAARREARERTAPESRTAADAARAQALAAGETPEEAQAEAAHAAVAHAAGRPYAPNVQPAMKRQAGEDIASSLARLADLHKQGALTDDEFTAAKAKVVGA